MHRPCRPSTEAAEERQRKKAEQHAPVVRALGLAYYWQSLLDDGKFASLTEIAKAEGIDRSYVSRVFKLTRVSPAIVEQALAGKVTMEALWRWGVLGAAGRGPKQDLLWYGSLEIPALDCKCHSLWLKGARLNANTHTLAAGLIVTSTRV